VLVLETEFMARALRDPETLALASRQEQRLVQHVAAALAQRPTAGGNRLEHDDAEVVAQLALAALRGIGQRAAATAASPRSPELLAAVLQGLPDAVVAARHGAGKPRRRSSNR
jgi:hypothetical protein